MEQLGDEENPQSAGADSPLIQGALLVELSETMVALLAEQGDAVVALADESNTMAKFAEQSKATIAQAPLNKGGGTEGDGGG